jgi:hypothetical protein
MRQLKALMGDNLCDEVESAAGVLAQRKRDGFRVDGWSREVAK